jgi:tetratricopeptide (TPR) repeat protein
VTPRLRVYAAVASLAVAAAAVVAGAAALQSRNDPPREADRPDGRPPLVLDLGVRGDAEAVALRRASTAYAEGRTEDAAAAFARYRSREARIGAALAGWPDGTVSRLRELAREQPRSAAVRLHLGLALLWSGAEQEAVGEWRTALRVQPDSLSAVRADDLLHLDFPRGLPVFVPGFAAPAELDGLAPAARLDRLRRDAESSVRSKLLYGAALQQLGRPLSARRVFDEAAAAPGPLRLEAQVAAAVARFDKDRPEQAFSRLGPLSKANPRSQTVRFHLGLLLLWLGELDPARQQLERARAVDPGSRLGREANRFLDRLEDAGTDRPER